LSSISSVVVVVDVVENRLVRYFDDDKEDVARDDTFDGVNASLIGVGIGGGAGGMVKNGFVNIAPVAAVGDEGRDEEVSGGIITGDDGRGGLRIDNVRCRVEGDENGLLAIVDKLRRLVGDFNELGFGPGKGFAPGILF